MRTAHIWSLFPDTSEFSDRFLDLKLARKCPLASSRLLSAQVPSINKLKLQSRMGITMALLHQYFCRDCGVSKIATNDCVASTCKKRRIKEGPSWTVWLRAMCMPCTESVFSFGWFLNVCWASPHMFRLNRTALTKTAHIWNEEKQGDCDTLCWMQRQDETPRNAGGTRSLAVGSFVQNRASSKVLVLSRKQTRWSDSNASCGFGLLPLCHWLQDVAILHV